LSPDHDTRPASVVENLRDRDASVPERPVPDLDPGDYEQWPDDAPDDHRIVTSGVASMVYDADRELLGHVLMLDLDDVDPTAAIAEADRLDEHAVVVRSSHRCYHVVGLDVRPWDQRVADARDAASSPEFVDEMVDQGRFIMRTQPKLRRESGDIYKHAPEPVHLARGVGVVSTPHLTVLRQLAEESGYPSMVGVLNALESAADGVGRTLTQSTYESMTDELRALVGHPDGGETDGE